MKNSMHALRAGLPVICFGMIQATAHAGEPAAKAPIPETDSSGDWCQWLSSKPGTLYKNSENPIIQEFSFGGRFHWQAAYLSGTTSTGYNFSDTHTEFRRFRLNAGAKVLNYFTLKAYVNMVLDTTNSVAAAALGADEVNWGYQNFDQAHVTFDAKKAFGIDSVDGLTLTYGRLKNEITSEAWESSKRLLTVERSALSNKVFFGGLPTGATLNLKKGAWDLYASLYSTDALTPVGVNTEFIGGWNDGLAYRASVGFQATDDLNLRWDFIYNDAEGTRGDDSLFRYKWVTAFSAAYEQEKWGVITDFIYGDNGDADNAVFRADRQGDFWGLVVMPYYWIVEDKLQGVVRYQYQGSEEAQGVRINSRYGRADHGPAVNGSPFSSGRGDEHHAVYAGVNYLICGHNLKVQAGLEYDWINLPGAGTRGDASSLTSWFGFRSYF